MAYSLLQYQGWLDNLLSSRHQEQSEILTQNYIRIIFPKQHCEMVYKMSVLQNDFTKKYLYKKLSNIGDASLKKFFNNKTEYQTKITLLYDKKISLINNRFSNYEKRLIDLNKETEAFSSDKSKRQSFFNKNYDKLIEDFIEYELNSLEKLKNEISNLQ